MPVDYPGGIRQRLSRRSNNRQDALGPQAVDNLSHLTGVAGPDPMSELSSVLPGIIDRLAKAPHAQPGGDVSLVRRSARSGTKRVAVRL